MHRRQIRDKRRGFSSIAPVSRMLHGIRLTKRVELGLALGEALNVGGVDEEDDSVNLGEVLAPQATGLHVSTEVVGGEANVADSELLRGGVKGRLEGGETVILEHVKEGLRRQHACALSVEAHAASP